MDAERKQHEAWDPQYRFASRVSDVLEAVAKHHFKIEIDEMTSSAWADLMGWMREVDTASDDFDKHPQILEAIRNFDPFRDRYPHIAPEALSPERAVDFVHTTASIFNMGRQMAEPQTMERFFGLRQHEARLTARLYSITASDAVRAQPAFDNEFMPALTRIVIAANFFDTSRDMNKDYYRDHTLGIKPGREFRNRLLGLTAIGIKEDYKVFLHPRIWGPYSRLVAVGFYSHHKKNQQRRREAKLHG